MSAAFPAQLAAAAEGLVGTPFRLYGRDPATGLDCVGLVAETLRRCGRDPVIPIGYRLRALDLGPLLRFAAANGLLVTDGALAVGDILLVHMLGVQPHLLVAVSHDRFVHAHAGLGRVVVEPGPCRWPLAGSWRFDAKG